MDEWVLTLAEYSSLQLFLSLHSSPPAPPYTSASEKTRRWAVSPTGSLLTRQTYSFPPIRGRYYDPEKMQLHTGVTV